MALFLQGPTTTTPPPHGPRSEPFVFNDLPIFPFRLLTSFDSSPRSSEPDHEPDVESGRITAISDCDDDRIELHSPPRVVSISSPLQSSPGPRMGSPFQDVAMRPPTPPRDPDADDRVLELSPICASPLHPSSPPSPDAMIGAAPAELSIPVFGEDDSPAPPTNPEGSPERPLVPTNAADWEAKKDIIQELYMNKNLILNDVVNIMLSTHNFKATYVYYQYTLQQGTMLTRVDGHAGRECTKASLQSGDGPNTTSRAIPTQVILANSNQQNRGQPGGRIP